MNLTEKLIEILRDPSDFFETVKSENIKDTISFLLKITAIFSLIVLPATYFSLNRRLALLGFGEASFLSITSVYIFSLASLIVLTFIWVGIIHLSVKLFKGFGKYDDTYKAIVYSYVPLFAVGILAAYFGIFSDPIQLLLAFIAFAWSIIVKIVGLSELHIMSKLNAGLGYSVPVLILLLIYFLS